MNRKYIAFLILNCLVLNVLLVNLSGNVLDSTTLLKNMVLKKYNINLQLDPDIWSSAEVVSTSCHSDSYKPSLAVDSSGNIHIVWKDESDYGSGSDTDIFYRRWNSSTSLWTTIEIVSNESTNDCWFPSLAVDTFGNAHIVWGEASTYGGSGSDEDVFYRFWNATSASWDLTEVVSTESTATSSVPDIAVDFSGNVYVTWRDWTFFDGSGSDIDIFYKRWTVTTASWETTEVISTESTQDSYGSVIGIDSSGNIHITWIDGTNYAGSGSDYDVFYKRWNATSASWGLTEVVSTESTAYTNMPSLTIDFSGNVHIAWRDESQYDDSGSYWNIAYKHWNASSTSWSTTEVASLGTTLYTDDPSIGADPNGNIHVVWFQYPMDNVYYNSRDASTGSWKYPGRISVENGGFGSFSPSLFADSLGCIHVAYADSTGYSGSGADNDILYKKKTLDGDKDGMDDEWELFHGLNPNVDDSAEDPDSDGLTNLEEFNARTNPQNGDSDNDGMPDGWEVNYGLNPLADDSGGDLDDDGLTNLQEFQYNTNPLNADSDGDGFDDASEIENDTDPLDAEDYPEDNGTDKISYLIIIPLMALLVISCIKKKNKKEN